MPKCEWQEATQDVQACYRRFLVVFNRSEQLFRECIHLRLWCLPTYPGSIAGSRRLANSRAWSANAFQANNR
jgi:hypothetical protein